MRTLQYQEVNRNVQRLIKDMYSKIGTPDSQKQLKQEWRQHLSEVEQRLSSFKKSRFQPVSSPENSQVGVSVCMSVCLRIKYNNEDTTAFFYTYN